MATLASVETLPTVRAKRDASLRRRRFMTLLFTYAALMLIVAFMLFPLYWMVITSLKLPREIYRVPVALAGSLHRDNYRTLIDEKDFLINIKNSLIVACS